MKKAITNFKTILAKAKKAIKEKKNDEAWGYYGRLQECLFELQDAGLSEDKLEQIRGKLAGEMARFLISEKNYLQALPHLILYSAILDKEVDLVAFAEKAGIKSLSKERVDKFIKDYRADKNSQPPEIWAFVQNYADQKGENNSTNYATLDEWADSALTSEEAEQVQCDSDYFTKEIERDSVIDAKTVRAVALMAQEFSKKVDLHIGIKFANFGFDSVGLVRKAIDRHHVLSSLAEVFYKDRANDDSVGKFEKACRMSFRFSGKVLPMLQKEAYKSLIDNFKPEQENWVKEQTNIQYHYGYKQMAIHLDKKKEFAEAIKLCEKARDEGWFGDWDERIEKLQKKLDKQKS